MFMAFDSRHVGSPLEEWADPVVSRCDEVPARFSTTDRSRDVSWAV